MTADNITKFCRKCCENKPAEAFYAHKKYKDGLRSNCKKCEKGYRASKAVKLPPVESFPNEEWKPIKGHESEFIISNHGRVQRVSGARGTRAGRLLSLTRNDSGYPVICLREGQKHLIKRVHKLVAEAFIGICPSGMVVNHKNCVRHDNRVENLEYVTPQGNSDHAAKMGRMRPGEQSNWSKLSEDVVRDIRHKRAQDATYADLVARFHTSFGNVAHIVNRRTWKHI